MKNKLFELGYKEYKKSLESKSGFIYTPPKLKKILCIKCNEMKDEVPVYINLYDEDKFTCYDCWMKEPKPLKKSDIPVTILNPEDIDWIMDCFLCGKCAFNGGWWFNVDRRRCCDDCMTDELRKEYYNQFGE